MKPSSKIKFTNRRHDLDASNTRTSPKSPQTDYCFQTTSAADFGRCHASNRSSFRTISESYFKTEARRSFIAEAAFFAVIVITSAIPLLTGAGVVVKLLRSMSAV